MSKVNQPESSQDTEDTMADKATATDQENRLRHLKAKRNGHSSYIARLINELNPMLLAVDIPTDAWFNKRDTLVAQFANALGANDNIIDLVLSETDKNECFEFRKQKIDQRNVLLKLIDARIGSSDEGPMDDVKASDSVSQAGQVRPAAHALHVPRESRDTEAVSYVDSQQKSITSSVRSKINAEKARIRMEQLKKEQELQRQQLEIQQKIEMCRAEGEVRLAMSDVGGRSAEVSLQGRTERTLQEPQVRRSPPAGIPNSTELHQVTPSTSASIHSDALLKIQEQQLKLMEKLTLPPPKPSVFTGSVEDYPRWISAFTALVHNDSVDPGSKLYYLEEYTAGDAKDAVAPYLSEKTESAFEEAMATLKKIFGDPYSIYSVYKKRLDAWPKCKTSESLRKFLNYLKLTHQAMKTVKTMNSLSDPEFLKALLVRLPSQYHKKWRDKAKAKRDTSEMPEFTDFLKFVEECVEDAADPIFGYEALRTKVEEVEMSVSSSRSLSSSKDGNRPTLYRQSRSVNSLKTATEEEEAIKCIQCSKPHEVQQCKEFNTLDHKKKIEVLKNNGVCFSCLRRGHKAKFCKQRLKCDVCMRKHPTTLHEERNVGEPNGAADGQDSNEEATASSFCNRNETAEHCYASPIVPARLSHVSAPEKSVVVYALLDEQSDATFVLTDVLRRLNVKGSDVDLRLSTMHGSDVMRTQLVDGLRVQCLKGDVMIDLPRVYASDNIPAKRNQIPTQEMAMKFGCFKRIAKDILPCNKDTTVGLLIGCNCPRAIKPREVIAGEPDGPYAIRTCLGWGIVGPIDASGGSGETIVHKMITSEGSTPGILVGRDGAKEEMSLQRVLQMFERDSNDGPPETPVMSEEHRKFLALMDDEVVHLENKHYQLPLPLRPGVELPDNKKYVYHRLQGLRKKLGGNKTYKGDRHEQTIADIPKVRLEHPSTVLQQATQVVSRNAETTWCLFRPQSN